MRRTHLAFAATSPSLPVSNNDPSRRDILRWAAASSAFMVGMPVARANPVMLEVLIWLGEFAAGIAADVISTYIYDYLTTPEAPRYPTTAISQAKHHETEMRSTGYVAVQRRTYRLKSFSFYGMERQSGGDGCVIAIGEGGVSCLGAPAILAFHRAARDIHRTELISNPQHIGLALLPKDPIEVGGADHSYATEYQSDGFVVELAYQMKSFDASNGTASGRSTIVLRRLGAAAGSKPFFEGVYDV